MHFLTYSIAFCTRISTHIVHSDVHAAHFAQAVCTFSSHNHFAPSFCTIISHQHFAQSFRTSISHKHCAQAFCTIILHNQFAQSLCTIISHKHFAQAFCTNIFMKTFQEAASVALLCSVSMNTGALRVCHYCHDRKRIWRWHRWLCHVEPHWRKGILAPNSHCPGQQHRFLCRQHCHVPAQHRL